MIDPLLLPLDSLPGPVPVGVWGRHRYQDHAGDLGMIVGYHATGSTKGWPIIDDGRARVFGPPACSPKEVEIDLRPPPLADGWPTRVDALPIVVGMVARALEIDEAIMEVRPQGVGVAVIFRVGAEPVVVFYPPSDGGFGSVPALADIDRNDPDRVRLALAAIVRAKVWL